MPVRKYYCDYCDKQFQDTPGDRKRHAQGIQHQQAKARWYDSFKQQIPPIPNQPLCFHFVNTGFCRYGHSCKYLHPILNNNIQQQAPIMNTPSPGNVVGVSLGNLPPSLQLPPEGGYPHLPFLDWG
ncbi:Zinc finger CCCH domain-containing protein 3 [Mucuna pruriens]|uniref:Zinc finger CCCH domain-containing protein 3 n=1 Tax=Mucuna pruriens TaxID=157652 RepID=A0A371EU35_MUCPR|nr:Zinc finger CCCH domain-containing protein 3 [Mucuna pruriens]